MAISSVAGRWATSRDDVEQQDQGQLERLPQAPHDAAVALPVRLDPQRQLAVYPAMVAGG
jgi:hypothetical protein